MDRINLAVSAAGQVVRTEFQIEVLVVIASPVVVFNLQVAVAPQALCDHQVVRLVATGVEHRVDEA
jgi:hypothetical protein